MTLAPPFPPLDVTGEQGVASVYMVTVGVLISVILAALAVGTFTQSRAKRQLTLRVLLTVACTIIAYGVRLAGSGIVLPSPEARWIPISAFVGVAFTMVSGATFYLDYLELTWESNKCERQAAVQGRIAELRRGPIRWTYLSCFVTPALACLGRIFPWLPGAWAFSIFNPLPVVLNTPVVLFVWGEINNTQFASSERYTRVVTGLLETVWIFTPAIANGLVIAGNISAATDEMLIVIATLSGTLAHILNIVIFPVIYDEFHLQHKDVQLLEQRIRLQEEQDEQKRKQYRFVFHELRVPLNSIALGLRLLLEEDAVAPREEKLGDEAKNSVLLMKTAADTMMTIVSDLLDFARIESNAFKIALRPVHLASLLREAAGQMLGFAQGRNVQLSVVLPHNLPRWVVADPVRISQVVLNYLSNALKFVDGSGSGVVEVRASVLGTLQVGMGDEVPGERERTGNSIYVAQELPVTGTLMSIADGERDRRRGALAGNEAPGAASATASGVRAKGGRGLGVMRRRKGEAGGNGAAGVVTGGDSASGSSASASAAAGAIAPLAGSSDAGEGGGLDDTWGLPSASTTAGASSASARAGASPSPDAAMLDDEAFTVIEPVASDRSSGSSLKPMALSVPPLRNTPSQAHLAISLPLDRAAAPGGGAGADGGAGAAPGSSASAAVALSMPERTSAGTPAAPASSLAPKSGGDGSALHKVRHVVGHALQKLHLGHTDHAEGCESCAKKARAAASSSAAPAPGMLTAAASAPPSPALRASPASAFNPDAAPSAAATQLAASLPTTVGVLSARGGSGAERPQLTMHALSSGALELRAEPRATAAGEEEGDGAPLALLCDLGEVQEGINSDHHLFQARRLAVDRTTATCRNTERLKAFKEATGFDCTGKNVVVRIEVRDNGVGMSNEEMHVLYTAFQQTSSGLNAKLSRGTGLGLAIVREIVAKHGGTVGVVSKPGAGSIFYCDIPFRAVVPMGTAPGGDGQPLLVLNHPGHDVFMPPPYGTMHSSGAGDASASSGSSSQYSGRGGAGGGGSAPPPLQAMSSGASALWSDRSAVSDGSDSGHPHRLPMPSPPSLPVGLLPRGIPTSYTVVNVNAGVLQTVTARNPRKVGQFANLGGGAAAGGSSSQAGKRQSRAYGDGSHSGAPTGGSGGSLPLYGEESDGGSSANNSGGGMRAGSATSGGPPVVALMSSSGSAGDGSSASGSSRSRSADASPRDTGSSRSAGLVQDVAAAATLSSPRLGARGPVSPQNSTLGRRTSSAASATGTINIAGLGIHNTLAMAEAASRKALTAATGTASASSPGGIGGGGVKGGGDGLLISPRRLSASEGSGATAGNTSSRVVAACPVCSSREEGCCTSGSSRGLGRSTSGGGGAGVAPGSPALSSSSASSSSSNIATGSSYNNVRLMTVVGTLQLPGGGAADASAGAHGHSHGHHHHHHHHHGPHTHSSGIPASVPSLGSAWASAALPTGRSTLLSDSAVTASGPPTGRAAAPTPGEIARATGRNEYFTELRTGDFWLSPPAMPMPVVLSDASALGLTGCAEEGTSTSSTSSAGRGAGSGSSCGLPGTAAAGAAAVLAAAAVSEPAPVAASSSSEAGTLASSSASVAPSAAAAGASSISSSSSSSSSSSVAATAPSSVSVASASSAPAADASLAVAADAAPSPARRRLRILVVEDDPGCRKLQGRLLKVLLGAEIESAEDGQAALDAVTRFGLSYFDAILMDNSMPVMSGLEATVRLKAMGCTSVLIGATGNALEQDMAGFIAAGVAIVLTKPLDTDKLMATVLDLVGASLGEEAMKAIILPPRQPRKF